MNIENAKLLASQFSSFQLRAFETALSVKHGFNPKQRSGPGEVFWQFREHMSDDAIREIDWKRSGRSDGLVVREREKEGTQDIWLWRSASSSMAFHSGITQARKDELTELIILALGIILLNSGGSISFLGSNSLPKKGSRGLNNLIEGLRVQKPYETFPYQLGLSQYCEIIMIGDFLAPAEEYELITKNMTKNGCRGTCIQILDPAEETFPFSGKIEFNDMQNSQTRLIYRAEEIRQGYLSRLAADRKTLKTTLDNIGWLFQNFTTEITAEEIISNILKELILSRNLIR